MIVITGASDGLGLQIAKVFAESGATVVNVSRTECEYASVTIKTDLHSDKDIQSTARQIGQMSDPIDALINCAGVLSFQKVGSITPMWGEMDDKYKSKMASGHLIGRWIEPSEIADGIVFLAKNDAVCGEILVIDGGMSLKVVNDND